MTAELTLGVEEELHLIDLESGELVRAGAAAAVPAARGELLRRDPAHHGRDQHRRGRHSRRAARRAASGCARAWSTWPAGGARRRRGRHRAAVRVRRLRADHHRPVRPDAGGVPAAGRRAADLRPAGPRRRRRPRPRGARSPSGSPATCRRCSPCRPARRSGTAPTPATRASGRSSGSAGRPPARPARCASAAEYDRPGRRPDRLRGDRGRRRWPTSTSGPSSHVPTARAAGLRRLPGRRRRGPDRRPVPGAGRRRPSTRSRPGGRSRRSRRRSTARRCGGPPAAAWPATCSTSSRHPRPIPAADRRSERWSSGSRPQLRRARRLRAGVRELTEAILARGNSADRQRAAFAERGRLEDVVELVVTETHGRPTASSRTRRCCGRTRIRAGRRGRRPRRTRPAGVPPTWSRRTRAMGIDDVPAREQAAGRVDRRPRRHLRRRRRAAAVPGRPGAADHPGARVAGPVRGADPAGPGDRGVPARHLRRAAAARRRRRCRPTGCVGRRAGATRRPRLPAEHASGRRSWGSTWSATSSAAGGCWRTTSGSRPASAYAIGDPRADATTSLPELPRPSRICSIRPTRSRLLRPHPAAPRRAAGDGGRRAVRPTAPATPPGTSTGPLAERGRAAAGRSRPTCEVRRRRGGPRRRTVSGSTSLYLRLDDELVDLRDGSGRRDRRPDPRGRPQDGGVVLANAPGNGIADDKAMYCLRRRSSSATTWTSGRCSSRCRRTAVRQPGRAGPVLDRVGELVTKPVDGYGGGGRADRPGRHRRRGARAGARRSQPTRPRGSPRRSSRCRPTRPSSGDRLRAAARRPAGVRVPHAAPAPTTCISPTSR